MLMGRFMRKQRYSNGDYIMALFLAIGASIFFFSVNIETNTTKSTINDGFINQNYTTISGLILMLGYLVFDSFTPNYQKKLLEARVSTCQVSVKFLAFIRL